MLGIYISEERTIIIAEKFIRSLVSKYGKYTVYTDGGTWYDAACNVIGLKHYVHSSIEKSLMERVNQYLKVRKVGYIFSRVDGVEKENVIDVTTGT